MEIKNCNKNGEILQNSQKAEQEQQRSYKDLEFHSRLKTKN